MGNTVILGTDSNNNLKNIKVNEAGGLVIAPPKNNPLATGAIDSGQLKCTTGGTAIIFPTVNIGQYVYIKANSNNTANIFIGVSGVTTTANGSGNGCILEPGDFVYLTIDNLNRLYMNCANNTDFVSYILS